MPPILSLVVQSLVQHLHDFSKISPEASRNQVLPFATVSIILMDLSVPIIRKYSELVHLLARRRGVRVTCCIPDLVLGTRVAKVLRYSKCAFHD